MTNCCENCWNYSECTKKGQCCDECDHFGDGKCTYSDDDFDKWVVGEEFSEY